MDDTEEMSSLFTKFSLAKQWGNEIYKKALKSSETVTKAIMDQMNIDSVKTVISEVSIVRQFDKAYQQFAQELEKEGRLGNSNMSTSCGLPVQPFEADRLYTSSQVDPNDFVAPWDPSRSGIADPQWTNAFRDRILNLSLQVNNFLIAPPDEAHWNWTSPMSCVFVHDAQVLLKLDPNLDLIRYRLVPKKISEDLFWCNYFYRISLVRQSLQLSNLANQAANNDENLLDSAKYACKDDNSSSIGSNYVCVEPDAQEKSDPQLDKKNTPISKDQIDLHTSVILDRKLEEEIEREVDELIFSQTKKSFTNTDSEEDEDEGENYDLKLSEDEDFLAADTEHC